MNREVSHVCHNGLFSPISTECFFFRSASFVKLYGTNVKCAIHFYKALPSAKSTAYIKGILPPHNQDFCKINKFGVITKSQNIHDSTLFFPIEQKSKVLFSKIILNY